MLRDQFPSQTTLLHRAAEESHAHGPKANHETASPRPTGANPLSALAKVMETVKAMAMVTQLVALHRFEPSHQKGATKKHRGHKKHKTAEEGLLYFLCLFVASSLF